TTGADGGLAHVVDQQRPAARFLAGPPHRGVARGLADHPLLDRRVELRADADAGRVPDLALRVDQIDAGVLGAEGLARRAGQQLAGVLDAGRNHAVLEEPAD